MHRRGATQCQRITGINHRRDQRQRIALGQPRIQQRARIALAHHPDHADKRQRHPQPLQRMRPSAQTKDLDQQHHHRNQGGDNRHIDHRSAARKRAVQHNIKKRETAAADDQQPPRPPLEHGQIMTNPCAEQPRQQRRRQHPAPESERIRRQPHLAELAGDITRRPKKRRQKKHDIRMRQAVCLPKTKRHEKTPTRKKRRNHTKPALPEKSGCAVAVQRDYWAAMHRSLAL